MLALIKKYTYLFSLFIASLLFLFIAPNNSYANHFRAGSMSWESVEGEDRTVLIKMQVGWTNNHGHIPSATPIGGVVTNKLTLYFGDGTSLNAALRVTSRNSTTNDVQTELVMETVTTPKECLKRIVQMETLLLIGGVVRVKAL
jgi:hypothetical protein